LDQVAAKQSNFQAHVALFGASKKGMPLHPCAQADCCSNLRRETPILRKGSMKVRISQPRANRFCVFVEAGQIAAIEYGDDDTISIERFGAQPFSNADLKKLAEVFRATGKNGGTPAIGQSWSVVRQGSDWKVSQEK
jgi:hypothetical protein